MMRRLLVAEVGHSELSRLSNQEQGTSNNKD